MEQVAQAGVSQAIMSASHQVCLTHLLCVNSLFKLIAEGDLDYATVPGLSTFYPSALITALRPDRGSRAILKLYR